MLTEDTRAKCLDFNWHWMRYKVWAHLWSRNQHISLGLFDIKFKETILIDIYGSLFYTLYRYHIYKFLHVNNFDEMELQRNGDEKKNTNRTKFKIMSSMKYIVINDGALHAFLHKVTVTKTRTKGLLHFLSLFSCLYHSQSLYSELTTSNNINQVMVRVFLRHQNNFHLRRLISIHMATLKPHR